MLPLSSGGSLRKTYQLNAKHFVFMTSHNLMTNVQVPFDSSSSPAISLLNLSNPFFPKHSLC